MFLSTITFFGLVLAAVIGLVLVSLALVLLTTSGMPSTHKIRSLHLSFSSPTITSALLAPLSEPATPDKGTPVVMEVPYAPTKAPPASMSQPLRKASVYRQLFVVTDDECDSPLGPQAPLSDMLGPLLQDRNCHSDTQSDAGMSSSGSIQSDADLSSKQPAAAKDQSKKTRKSKKKDSKDITSSGSIKAAKEAAKAVAMEQSWHTGKANSDVGSGDLPRDSTRVFQASSQRKAHGANGSVVARKSQQQRNNPSPRDEHAAKDQPWKAATAPLSPGQAPFASFSPVRKLQPLQVNRGPAALVGSAAGEEKWSHSHNHLSAPVWHVARSPPAVGAKGFGARHTSNDAQAWRLELPAAA